MLLLKILTGLAAAGVVCEFAITGYFFRRTMIRSNAKRERTQKMSGTDWDKYIPHIRELPLALFQNHMAFEYSCILLNYYSNI